MSIRRCDIDLTQCTLADLTDSVGAARIISKRHGIVYSPESVRQLVKQNRLRCLMFENGILVERNPSELTRGRDLFFLRSDIEALARPKRGRPEKKDDHVS